MNIKSAFIVSLLGCTMLTACKGSDDTQSAQATPSTFSSAADAAPQQPATPPPSNYDADIAALKQANAATSATLVETQTQLTSVQTQLAAVQTPAGTDNADLDALKKQNETISASLATLQAQLADGQSKIDALQTQAGTSSADIDTLKQNNATLSASLAAAQTALADVQGKLSALQTKASDDDSAIAALQQNNAATAAALAKVQDTLTAVQAQAAADHKTTIALVANKMLTQDLPALADKLKQAQANQLGLAPVGSAIDKLLTDIAALQATPGLSTDQQTGLVALLAKANTLKADYTAAIGPGSDIGKAFSDTNALLAAITATANDPDATVALADSLAAAPQALDTAAKTATDDNITLTARLAALNNNLEYLRPRADVPLTQFVNLFIGTSNNSNSGFSGNLGPGAQVPFGGVNFSTSMPHSDYNGSGGYQYSSYSIPYFTMTHLNGPGCTNQGTVALMPKATTTPLNGGASEGFSRTNGSEVATPGYYKVKFNNGITSEFTATSRTGMARITYASSDAAYLMVDATLNDLVRSGVPNNLVSMTLGADNQSISGQTLNSSFCTPYGYSWNQPVYFYAAFDKPLKPATATINTVANARTALQFDLQPTDLTVQVKIGISSVSAANARTNLLGDSAAGLTGENTGWAFDDVRKQADTAWNKRLNTIQIDLAKGDPAAITAAQKDKLTQFYTALYRVFGGPSVYSDLNGEFRSMQQLKDATGAWPPKNTGSNGTTPIPVRATANVADYTYTKPDGSTAGYKTHYTAFSLWDTYRSQSQFLAWTAPSEAGDMMQSLVADATQCGAFPHWVDGAEDNTPMFGDNALNVVAGSYAFGAQNFDLAKAAGFFKQDLFDPNSICNNKNSVGGAANLNSYETYGYIPNATSSNLEMITQDRSAATFLKALPAATLLSSGATQSDIDTLAARASNWTTIFDNTSKTLRARAAGSLDTSGKPVAGALVNGTFQESTEPNYFWSFAQDWTALINKLGTDRPSSVAAALVRLNKLFSLDPSLTGTEPSAGQLNGGETSTGYYAGNEMNFSTPWAYNWTGSPKYAQYIIPSILTKTFNNSASGLPGNDDLGALSAFYVWSSLGLYPVIPSQGGLAVSTPQFDGITVWLGNGSKLRLTTGGQQALIDNVRFIADMKLNDGTYQGTWLPLDKIANGGRLDYTLSKTATNWSAGEAFIPPSGANADYSQPTASPLPPPVQVIQ